MALGRVVWEDLFAMHATTFLFPTGNARLSTIIVLAFFVTLALTRKSWTPIIAAAVWLFSFELALHVTLLALGRPGTLDPIHLSAYAAVTVAFPAWLRLRGIKPSWLLLALASAVWVVWVAIGFHVNGHSMVGFDSAAEACNEGAKTLLAAAFLLPLVRSDAVPRMDAAPTARQAAAADLGANRRD